MDRMTEPRRLATDALLERLPEHARAAFHEGREQGPAPLDRLESAEDRQARLAAKAQAYAARWVRTTPPMYVAASLEDLAAEQHAAAIAGWLDSPSATLVLAGSVGTGKTHAAYAVGHEAVKRGMWVEAWTVADFLEAIRPNGNADALSNARACDLLLLDDLGATSASPFSVEAMTSLLDHRIRERRRQVVTTNQPFVALQEVWLPRFTDRLIYQATTLALTGQSRRKAAW